MSQVTSVVHVKLAETPTPLQRICVRTDAFREPDGIAVLRSNRPKSRHGCRLAERAHTSRGAFACRMCRAANTKCTILHMRGSRCHLAGQPLGSIRQLFPN